MTPTKKILLVLLVLLSLATGVTKLIRMPEEMALFRAAQFPDLLTLLFGGFQVVGGLLLISAKTRQMGAIIMATTFTIASMVVFINHMVEFGLVSILFIIMCIPFVKG